MDMIRVYNHYAGEILEKTFADPVDADDFESILDFWKVRYERFHDGERLY